MGAAHGPAAVNLRPDHDTEAALAWAYLTPAQQQALREGLFPDFDDPVRGLSCCLEAFHRVVRDHPEEIPAELVRRLLADAREHDQRQQN